MFGSGKIVMGRDPVHEYLRHAGCRVADMPAQNLLLYRDIFSAKSLRVAYKGFDVLALDIFEELRRIHRACGKWFFDQHSGFIASFERRPNGSDMIVVCSANHDRVDLGSPKKLNIVRREKVSAKLT